MDAVFALQNEASVQCRAYETTQLLFQERELEKRYQEALEKRAKEALEKCRKAEQAKNERDMGRNDGEKGGI